MYLEMYYLVKRNAVLGSAVRAFVLFVASVMLYTTILRYNYTYLNVLALVIYALIILSVIPRVKWAMRDKKRLANFFISFTCSATIAISFAVLYVVTMWKYNLI